MENKKLILTDKTDILIEKIRLFVINAVKKTRYEHSVRVAETAAALCAKYGLDEKLGKLAGISHDMCKDFSDSLLLALAAKDGKEITALENSKPALLHGRAAAVKLRCDFGVQNDDVLEAVAVHTFGKLSMSGLAKVIYVADKIEPGRPYATAEYIAKTEGLSLDALVCFVLEQNIAHLEKNGRAVASSTMQLLESLMRGQDEL